MRKKISVIVLIILIIGLLTFAACVDEKDENGLLKIDAPQNLALNGSTLSWDGVERADHYLIFVKDEEKGKTSATTFDLGTVVTGYGDFQIKIRAVGDGKKYGKSDFSKAIVYRKGNALDTPNVSVDNGAKLATWGAIENADGYSVTVVDGENKAVDTLDTKELSYSFADKKDGDDKDKYEKYDKYRISVIAKPAEDNSEYSDSLAGIAYYVNSKTLDTPVFSSMTATLIRWAAVTDAKSYTLRLTHSDGTYNEIETSATSYQRSKFNYDKIGTYNFTIRANGDNEVFYDSQFSENSDDYKITKLEGIAKENISLVYNSDGSASLSWSVLANTSANEFTLSLKALLADGTSQLENSATTKTISNKVTFVVGDIYDVFVYGTDGNAEKSNGETMIVYDMDGYLQVEYNGAHYPVEDSQGKKVAFDSFTPSASVDIVYDTAAGKFKLDPSVVNGSDGSVLKQNTEESADVTGSDGKQLYYFEQETDFDVEKSLVYDGDKVVSHNFTVKLDSIFIKKTVTDGDGGNSVTTYEYLLKNEANYGVLYDVAVAAGNNSTNFESSENAVTAGQYLSYKVPLKADNGDYSVNNAGEFAYMIINGFINPQNTATYQIQANIDFRGYEFVQTENFYGKIIGNNHTISNMVVGNKRMTNEGVIKFNDSVEEGNIVTNYSMFVNIKAGAAINNTFFMGMKFVGYDEDSVEKDASAIYVAPVAINNYGDISMVMVQSDGIKADSAYVAGMVVNNYSMITSSQVYAELEGRKVAGLAILNAPAENANSSIMESGFYGKIVSTVGEILKYDGKTLFGAGLVAENAANAHIIGCESIADVSVTANGLDAIYAGGLVAVNDGNIVNSYSGEFTLNNVYREITASGDKAYAGGLVALNEDGGKISDSYATGKASASLYVGGFVGLNKGDIVSSYSTGGTKRTGTHTGAFAGDNTGSISQTASYSTDSWAKDEFGKLFTSSEELDDIIGILYPSGTEAKMVMVNGKGFRNPIIKNRIYTKDLTVTMSPSQIITVKGVIVPASGEAVDIETEESDIHGNSSAKGNKIVIMLNRGAAYKLVYGIIK